MVVIPKVQIGFTWHLESQQQLARVKKDHICERCTQEFTWIWSDLLGLVSLGSPTVEIAGG